MYTLRIWLAAFLLILATAPFASIYFIRDNTRKFEEEERKYIQKFGTSEGLYGDCSGVSVLFPIAVMIYSATLALWSLLLIIIADSFSRQAVITQTILIGMLGAFPAILWVSLVILR